MSPPLSVYLATFALPRRDLMAGSALLAVLLIPVVVASLVAGVQGGVPTFLAIAMLIGAAAKLPLRHSLQLVAALSATAAVAVGLEGQTFAAAAFAALVCLLVAPANIVDNGLLAAVPALSVVYLASPAMSLDPAATAGWTAVGGLFIALLMAKVSQPRPLTGVTPPVAYRHAIVLAIALAVCIALVLHVSAPHGYWVPLTLALVLQPFVGETVTRAQQRVFGTLAGGLLAVVVAIVLAPWAVAAVVVVLLAFSVSMSLAGRVTQNVVLSTPAVVLLADLASRDTQVANTLERVAWTFLGAALAALLALLLHRADAARGGMGGDSAKGKDAPYEGR